MIETDEFVGPFNRLLEQLCQPETLRRVERGEDDGSAWRALRESGFLDAMLPEAEGGAELSPPAVAPLLIACGRYLLPCAFGETLVARALAAAGGTKLPVEGPVVLWPQDDAGSLRSMVPPVMGGATHALVQRGSRASLQPLSRSRAMLDGYRLVGAVLDLDATPLIVFDLPEQTVMNWAATITSASMAGAMGKVLEMTLEHVNNRRQFDRALASFQAIQQQVSEMTEHVAAVGMAARLALAKGLPGPDVIDAAIGKTVADGAATVVAAVAHATHGAIGITAEHDLSLYTRRLKRWQASFGSGGYWARLLGAARLEYTTGTTVDFLRAVQSAAGR
jgi:acyl-CoA dehydrogenase